MINEARVRQMIKLAVYDKNKSVREKRPAQYFRKDYIMIEMIKSFFSGTAAYVLGVLTWALYLTEKGAEISTAAFSASLILTAVLYVLFLGIYLLLTYIIYSKRYKKGCREIREYYHTLKRVNELYRREERNDKVD